MKKKGLIISTIVMVVVLIASLTTATYAWFNNSGSAKVTAINFEVAQAADLVIGVAEDNAYVAPVAGVVDPAAFWSDSTQWNAEGYSNKWHGSTNGLGLSVNTGLDLSSMEQAVYSFNPTLVYYKVVTEGGTTGASLKETYTALKGVFEDEVSYETTTADTATITAYATATPNVDTYTRTTTANPEGLQTNVAQTITAGVDPSHVMFKASGNGSALDGASARSAVAMTDYLNVAFGAAAAKDNIVAFGCMVYIQPTNTKTSLGLNASIHVAYQLNGSGTWNELDVYGASTHATTKTSLDNPGLPTVKIGEGAAKAFTSSITGAKKGDAWVYIPMFTASAADAEHCAVQDAIQQVQLLIYICGPDGDCITSATGVGAKITIEFLSMNLPTYTAA